MLEYIKTVNTRREGFSLCGYGEVSFLLSKPFTNKALWWWGGIIYRPISNLLLCSVNKANKVSVNFDRIVPMPASVIEITGEDYDYLSLWKEFYQHLV